MGQGPWESLSSSNASSPASLDARPGSPSRPPGLSEGRGSERFQRNRPGLSSHKRAGRRGWGAAGGSGDGRGGPALGLPVTGLRGGAPLPAPGGGKPVPPGIYPATPGTPVHPRAGQGAQTEEAWPQWGWDSEARGGLSPANGPPWNSTPQDSDSSWLPVPRILASTPRALGSLESSHIIFLKNQDFSIFFTLPFPSLLFRGSRDTVSQFCPFGNLDF